MNGLIALIMLMFLVTGWAYGIGAGTMRTLTEVITAIEKSITSLGGTIFLFFVSASSSPISPIPTSARSWRSASPSALQAANIGALPLLLGFIVVVAIIDLLLTGAIAKWAIFAPVFVPLLMKLGVEPEAVLAAYRVGDSPMNAITPLNAYFALVVGFAQKYDKGAGIGTIVSLMLPYVVWMFVTVDRAVRSLEGARIALGPLKIRQCERKGPDGHERAPSPSMSKAAEEHLMRFLSVEGVTGHEAKIAAAVSDELKKVGVPASAIRFDDANKRIPLPTETGNLIVDLPGTRSGPRLLFATHLDTVPLCAGAKPKREGDRIVADGTTALGGDNRTGCAVLVTLAETLLKHKLPASAASPCSSPCARRAACMAPARVQARRSRRRENVLQRRRQARVRADHRRRRTGELGG